LYDSEAVQRSNEILEDRATPKEVFEAQRMEIGGKIYRKVVTMEPGAYRPIEKTEWVLETEDMKPLNKQEVPSTKMSQNELDASRKTDKKHGW